VFGVDLQHLTSLEARDWLISAGSEPLALVAVPLDADVVSALTLQAEQPRALAAIDSLIASAGGSPIAVCLHRPPAAVSGVGIAQTAVATLTERYPNQITFIAACDPANDSEWRQAIVSAAAPELETARGWIPVSAGSAVEVVVLDSIDDLDAEGLAVRGGTGYRVFVIEIVQPLDTATIERAAAALGRSAASALIMLRPAPDLDPSTIVTSVELATISGNELPEGFSSVAGPGIGFSEGWQASSVGTIAYQRAIAPGASMAIEVVGTEVYLIGLLSPDGGEVAVWVDPDPTRMDQPPDTLVSLVSDQARDAAIPIATSLPAARHRVVLQVLGEDGSNVTIAGFFVAGRPVTSWTALLAAVGIIGIASAALGERSYASIAAIRASAGSDRQVAYGHPRGFARRR
jgi:hypothetical protein